MLYREVSGIVLSLLNRTKTSKQHVHVCYTFPHKDEDYVAFSCQLYQFSSVFDRFGRRGDLRNDSTGILFQFLLLEAVAGSPSIGRRRVTSKLENVIWLCPSDDENNTCSLLLNTGNQSYRSQPLKKKRKPYRIRL